MKVTKVSVGGNCVWTEIHVALLIVSEKENCQSSDILFEII